MSDNVFQNYILQQVITLSLENAETYLNDAELLINNSSFGHAIALTILALEEVGKAIYCNWAKNGFVKVNDDFFKGLKTHKTKLRVLKEIDKLIVLRTELNKYEESKNRRKIPCKSKSEMITFLTELEKSFQFKSIEAFYGELERMKQLAFYVDINQRGVPLSPRLFSKDICHKYLDFVQKVFTSTKGLSSRQNRQY